MKNFLPPDNTGLDLKRTTAHSPSTNNLLTSPSLNHAPDQPPADVVLRPEKETALLQAYGARPASSELSQGSPSGAGHRPAPDDADYLYNDDERRNDFLRLIKGELKPDFALAFGLPFIVLPMTAATAGIFLVLRQPSRLPDAFLSFWLHSLHLGKDALFVGLCALLALAAALLGAAWWGLWLSAGNATTTRGRWLARGILGGVFMGLGVLFLKILP